MLSTRRSTCYDKTARSTSCTSASSNTRPSRPSLEHRDGPVVVDVLVDRWALSLPSHVPAETLKGFTLSLAKQALHGKMDDIIETIEHNVRLL
jgi:hypothetical protein